MKGAEQESKTWHILCQSKIETSCGKAPGEKVLRNSPRLVVVRYQHGC